MKVQSSVVIRTVVLAAALVNQVLVLTGHNTLPFTQEQITQALTAAVTAAASLWSWWKNNSFTEAAQKGDEAMKEAKK